MNLPARLGRRDTPPTLGDILRVRMRDSADRLAITYDGRDLTYAELGAAAFRIATALKAEGLQSGDRIAVLAKNSDAFFQLLLGGALAGVVLAPLNWRLSPPEIGFLLEDSGAALLFVDAEFKALATAAAETGQAHPRILGLDDDGPTGFRAWRDGVRADDPETPVEPSDVVLQLYTSGTTGRPKGALLSHHALNSVRVSQPPEVAWSQWAECDVALISMPLFHVGGIGLALATLYFGARMVIVRDFAPETVLDFIEGEGVTKLFLVPAAIQLILDHPRARTTDYGRISYIIYGSSPITQPLLREAIAVFQCGFVQAYGMTETSGTVVALPPEDHGLDDAPKMGSAGKPLSGVEIAIIDSAGAKLPAGEMGEIVIRSPSNMIGYWRRPDESLASFTPDGFLRSGDAGYLDADGYLWIRDRVKDMIISGGENVYAAEVEAVLAAHPAVAEAAVIGVPDPKWGEAVKAIVVVAPGATVDLEGLRAWTRERLAAYKAPKSFEVVEALPRNASGKVLRRVLREPYWSGLDRTI